jgi:Domain of unknown function (DUF4349)
MRLSEEHPLDPEVSAELEAIDATLRGEAVDPIYAELAELALLLADERPAMPAQAADSLDAHVARRFEPAALAGGSGGGTTSRRPRLTRWALRPSFGALLAGLAAVAVVVVVVTQVAGNQGAGSSSSAGAGGISSLIAHAGTSGTSSASRAPTSAPGSYSTATTAGIPQATHGAGATAATTPSRTSGVAAGRKEAAHAPRSSNPAGAGSVQSGQSLSNAAAAPAPEAPVPTPPANGQKQIQSAQIQLLTAGKRIDAVSQEVFTVVGNEDGVVKSSTITAAGGNGGFASFRLSIPSGNLAQTMTDLSKLPYAHVASRTDETVNVNDSYQSDLRRLADARALRTSLLKQLAEAVTQTEIDSLDAQIKDNEAAIARDELALKRLNGRINFSRLLVLVNTGVIHPVQQKHEQAATGFTMHRAAHDALRVLTVATGVALIALAALVPVGLVLALLAWIGYWIRRRRREAALDSA